jgi:F-type H+-transporting ATPase subunit b
MQIDWWTLALQAINFLVLVWLLSRFLFRPVSEVIAKRKELAEAAFSEAEQREAEAEAARAEFEKKRAGLAKERDALLEKAHAEIEQDRAQAREEAKGEAESLLAEARDDIARERDSALRELRDEVAGMAGTLAGEILSQSGARVPPETLLARLEERLTALPDDERDRMQRDLEAADARLQVITAAELAATDRDAWRDGLAAILGHADRIDFGTDGELLGGVELRFPHSTLRLSWADQLRAAKDALLDDEDAT